MIATISPSKINGNIPVPVSKSAMQRACALALLNNGQTIIQKPGNSNDDLAAINIIKELGASVYAKDGCLIIESKGIIKPAREINCGESGLSFRMFAPIAALSETTVLLYGSGSLLKRPMHFIDEVFPLLGVKTDSNNGFLPVCIKGPLIPADIAIDGSLSSQYLTGLLFTFARATKKPVIISVSNLKSKPYIDLSLQLLAHFGYKVNHDNYEKFYINAIDSNEKNIIYITEGDWSSASFLLVAGAIAGSVKLSGLKIDSAQADKVIINILESCGADITMEDKCISVTNKKSLRAFNFDATDCPDLFPPLVVLAVNCNGQSVIKGISRLAGKESNRAEALVEVFTCLGVDIVIKDDDMIINGGAVIQSASVSSYYDHRIAMACAVAALNANGQVNIRHAEAVDKSYPDFYDHLKMLGAKISLSQD